MTAIGSQLAQSIERALNEKSLRGEARSSGDPLFQLADLARRFAAEEVYEEYRSAALSIADLARSGVSDGEQEGQFRHALLVLQRALPADEQPAVPDLGDDPELVQEFLSESREHLAHVESGVLRLEQEPTDAEALNAVFRSFHTIKGLAGFLGAPAIHELAHETENLLDLARAGNLLLTSDVIDLILRSADALNKCLAIASVGTLSDIPPCDRDLLARLADTAKNGVSPQTRADDGVDQDSSPAKVPESDKAPATPENNVLRVDASKLEHLIDMVGELVIAESVVRNHPALARAEDPMLSRHLTQLTRVVQEVQKTSMSMRMVAVGTLFRRMNRLIRDLNRKSGKLAELVTVGDDVELDRSIVEELADPMVHMIRNAVDHGLESPEERRRAGKSEKGIVRLEASHDAGDIVIGISDDGRGLNAARILDKARRRGLIGEHDPSDEESIFRLIFEPGFSTTETVTEMSGRGVGMDVVKKQIQKLRGRINIRSTPGQGCSFILRLPLTLAIIDGLVVGVGSQRFILPMFSIREMFSPNADTIVTLENRVEAALFRGRLLPVIRLSRLLTPESEERSGGVLIVTEGRDQLFCVAVDQLIGKQEVVIKSLGRTYRDVPAIAGGSILGDGRVGLIIDVNALCSGS